MKLKIHGNPPEKRVGPRNNVGKYLFTLRTAYESVLCTPQYSTSVLSYCYFHILGTPVNAGDGVLTINKIIILEHIREDY